MVNCERIKAARISAGLTQQQLGIMLGLPKETAQRNVSRWESGIRPVPKNKIISLMEILGLEITDLL